MPRGANNGGALGGGGSPPPNPPPPTEFCPSNISGLGGKILGAKRPKYGAEGAVLRKLWEILEKLQPKNAVKTNFLPFLRHKFFFLENETFCIHFFFKHKFFLVLMQNLALLMKNCRSKMQQKSIFRS